jgi:Flp pilus assembly protein TadD
MAVTTTKSTLRRWLPVTLLLALTALAYAPALRAGFVWDDDASVTGNRFITGPDGLRQLWFTTHAPDYWPVTSSAFWIEWRLWGLHPFGYHLVNLGLHGGAVILLWTVLRRLRLPGATLAALLFALHPVNVESVAWITQLKNLLALLFFLGSVYCFLRTDLAAGRAPRGRRAAAWYGASLLAAVLALLSKGSVAPLPFVLLGLIAWHRRVHLRDLWLLTPFFLASAGLAWVDVWFQAHQAAGSEVVRSAGALERLLGAGAVVWFYLGHALWPFHLAFVYPAWSVRAGHLAWWLPLLAALSATLLLVRLARGSGRAAPAARAGLFAWGYFCLMLVPVMGFVEIYYMRYALVADHYEHLALIGVVGFAGAAWAQWGRASAPPASGPFGPAARTLRLPVAAGVVTLLGFLTWRQCQAYRSAEQLYRTTLVQSPTASLPRYNLALLLATSGREAEAISTYEDYLRLNPLDAEAENNLGVLEAGAGRTADAIAHYTAALRLAPRFAEAHNNLGTAYAQDRGRRAEAAHEYEAAVRLRPGYPEAESNWGLLLAAGGDPAAALPHDRRAVLLKPQDASYHEALAAALAQLAGGTPESIAEYQVAARLRPDSARIRYNLAAELALLPDRREAAMAQYAEALRLQPAYAEAHNNLGILLAAAGRTDEARAHYAAALALNPRYAEAHNNLAVLLARLPGRLPEAIREEEQAVQLDPANAGAARNLARMRALLR